MPKYALTQVSTGAIVRYQDFPGAAPALSAKKDMAWLPVEEIKSAVGAGEVALPAATEIVGGKVVITEGKREQTPGEAFAAIPDRHILDAILDHLAGDGAALDAILAVRAATKGGA